MPRRFANCVFGPFQLRGLLRAKLLPGETVVGWGVVERASSGATMTLQLGLSMAPLVGPLLVAAMMNPRRRFLVLTDSRLLVLDAQASGNEVLRLALDKPSSIRVVAEAPIGGVTVVKTDEPRRFRVALDEHDDAQTISVPKQRSAAAERLALALALLATDENSDDARPRPGPGHA
ncbi:MAG: hypothetical protein KF684_12065 [Phycisphaeraceae bacterium]|nr:hypothetical protein [Phycisphaeraceae bacterium]